VPKFMMEQARHMAMFAVETSVGTEFVPCALVGDNPTPADLAEFAEGEVLADQELEIWVGWYSRFSATGYLDRTDWGGPYDTEDLALDALAELHDVCRSCFTDCGHSTRGICKQTP